MGLTPFSDVAFDFSGKVNSGTLPTTGYISRAAKGSGGMYQAFVGAGIAFGNFSVGAQALYYFGKIDKDFTYTMQSTASNSIYSGYELELNALTGKFGVQYETRLSNGLTVTVGATHRLRITVFRYRYPPLFAGYPWKEQRRCKTCRGNGNRYRHQKGRQMEI